MKGCSHRSNINNIQQPSLSTFIVWKFQKWGTRRLGTLNGKILKDPFCGHLAFQKPAPRPGLGMALIMLTFLLIAQPLAATKHRITGSKMKGPVSHGGLLS